VACRAALRSLAALPPGLKVAGVLCVAGWWTIDEPWPTIVPWVKATVDLDRARQACDRFVTLISDNDPFTSDHTENQRLWEERLGARVVVVPGAQHFNLSPQPPVLEQLTQLASAR